MVMRQVIAMVGKVIELVEGISKIEFCIYDH
jgi:hypothetical protein